MTISKEPAHPWALPISVKHERSSIKSCAKDEISLEIDICNTFPNTEPADNSQSVSSDNDAKVEDIIGNFGWFQMCIYVFSGLRDFTCSYDTVIMSVVLQPETDFTCSDTDRLPSSGRSMISGNVSLLVKEGQCFAAHWTDTVLNETRGIQCNQWTFANKTASTSMIAKWSLVCQNHWLVAVIMSAPFLGILLGDLIWGQVSDRFGRRKAYLISHMVSLIAGFAAIFAPTVWALILCRICLTIGNVGGYVLVSLQMELTGIKYRSFCTLLDHIGWGLGLCFVPVAYHLFDDYHMILAVTPPLTLILTPYAFWLPESPRWLMATRGDFEAARQTLRRAARFNGRYHKSDEKLDELISSMAQRISTETKALRYYRNGGAADARGDITGDDQGYKEPFSTLITNKTYLKDTLILCYAMFMGNASYFYLMFNFSYVKNLSLESNFFATAVSECMTCILAASLVRIIKRKSLMSAAFMILSLSYFIQAIIDSEILIASESSNSLALSIIVATNNTLGTVSAVGMFFIILMVSQEVYPTTLRQRGSSIVGCTAGVGSMVAPFLVQLIHLIGDWHLNIILMFPCIFGAVISYFLTVTDDSDLKDT